MPLISTHESFPGSASLPAMFTEDPISLAFVHCSQAGCLCCACEINADSSLKAFCEKAPNKPEVSARPGWKGSIPLAKPGYDCFNVRRKKRQNKRRQVGMIDLDKLGFD